jgi:NifU-like protein
MSFYPAAIEKRFRGPGRAHDLSDANASGRSANFDCGSFIAFDLSIDPVSKTIMHARFKTNGCGYMVAAADILSDALVGKHLTELHGLDRDELGNEVTGELGVLPPERVNCGAACIDALREAFADYRKRQIGEFSGEKALICTCFGISEETIENLIRKRPIRSIDEVGEICNAGRGCGSCRMLIQEMLDAGVEIE